jgi:hypothetical protein
VLPAGQLTPTASLEPGWTLVAASLALMMAFLDALVVTTALPTLRLSLHSSLASLEWTVTADPESLSQGPERESQRP